MEQVSLKICRKMFVPPCFNSVNSEIEFFIRVSHVVITHPPSIIKLSSNYERASRETERQNKNELLPKKWNKATMCHKHLQLQIFLFKSYFP